MEILESTIKTKDKKLLIVSLTLILIVTIFMIKGLINRDIENILLCLITLVFFYIPNFLEKKFKITFSSNLKIIILIFIFSSQILGRVNNFYGKISVFDNFAHTLNGFICASIGFSLFYLLIKNINSIRLARFFVPFMAFCFSMTSGVAWEFFEYGSDIIFKTDMQQDQYVYEINSTILDKQKKDVIKIKDIDYTIVYTKDNNTKITKGYLDIGLNDTMHDLIVNFIGACIFSPLGYLYMINNEKYKLIESLMIKKTK